MIKSIGDIVRVRGGKRLPIGFALQSTPNSHPYIRVRDISGRKLPSEGLEYVPNDVFAQISRYTVEENDLIVTIVGTIGDVCIVDKSYHFASLTENCAKLSGLDSYDALYLYYSLISDRGKAEIVRGTVGAVQAKLPLYAIEKIQIWWPPRECRVEAAEVLSNLDDKIEGNRRIAKTLEKMARAIFRSWFVDFDPVRAKVAAREEGRDPDRAATMVLAREGFISNQDNLYSLAKAFPAEMGSTEDMPLGWSLKELSSVLTVTIGKTPPRKEPEWFTESRDDVRWVSIRDMGSAGTFIQETAERLKPAALERFKIKIVPDKTVILSFKLTVGRVAITDGEMTTNEAIAHLRIPNESHLTPEYLYLYLKQFDFNQLASTSSIATAVNSDSVRAIPVLVPNIELLAAFQKIVSPMFARLRELQSESRTLAKIRDTLLPRLLSGQISHDNFQV